MARYILKRKSFTKWDDTDNLKRMKDSDILAEQKKEAPGYGNVASKSVGGAITGAAALGTAGAASGLLKKGARLATVGSRLKTGATLGAIGGALYLGGKALNKREAQSKETQFYNKRLKYAQKQAMRREKKDWKANMTQRDGYSY